MTAPLCFVYKTAEFYRKTLPLYPVRLAVRSCPHPTMGLFENYTHQFIFPPGYADPHIPGILSREGSL